MPKIFQTPTFKRAVKRLPKGQKSELDTAIRKIVDDPTCGEIKKGDLASIQVFKFRLNNNLALLAYEYFEKEDTLKLLALGSHENFYRDLKR